MHKRSSDNEFRDVLGSGLANARRNLVTVGIFSVAVNLLVLAIPIYLFNMSDRVLTSRSTDTLVMLTIIVVIAIAAHVLMDMMRRFILMRVAVETEAKLGGPGAERRRQSRAERIQPRIPDAGRPAAPPRVHYRAGIADDVRCAGRAGLFRRRVPDPSASRLHRAGLGRRAGHRGAAEPARHRGPVQPGEQLRRQGKPDRRNRWPATPRSSMRWA